MCIRVSSKAKVLIAKKDIRVYKRLVVKNNGNLISPYREIPYYIGKTKTAITDFLITIKRFNKFAKPGDIIELYEGIHSYNAKKTAMAKKVWDWNEEIFAAIIPAGSQYIKGLKNEIVSEKLKIIKQVKR